jgi:hypothetical protein
MQLETRETPEDLGFKVFKLASSNYKQWDVAAIDVAAIHVAAIHELPPPTWRVTDPDKGQSFHLTLAGKIALKDLRPLDLKKDNLFICRDIALDDEAAANLALQCRLKTI